MRLSTHGGRENEITGSGGVPNPVDRHNQSMSAVVVRAGDGQLQSAKSRNTTTVLLPSDSHRNQLLIGADNNDDNDDDDIGSELPTLSDRSSESNVIPIPTASMPIISISGHYDDGDVIIENHYDAAAYDLGGTSISSSTGSIGHGVDGLSPRDDAVYNIGSGSDAGSSGKKIRRDSSPSPIGNHLSVSPRLDSIPNGPPSPSNLDMSTHIKDMFLGSTTTERINPAHHPAENFIRAISPMHSASDFLDLHFPASNKAKSNRTHSVLKAKSRSVDDISELHSMDNRSETSPTGSPIPDNRSFIEEFIHDMGGMEGLPELSLDSRDPSSQQRTSARKPFSPPWNQSQSPQQQQQHQHQHLSPSRQQSQYLDPSPPRESGSSNTKLPSPPPPPSDSHRPSAQTDQPLHQQQHFSQQSGSAPQETHLSVHSSPSHSQQSHSVEHPHGEHPSRTLFVRNINSTVEDEELRVLFEAYGPIRHMYTQCKHRGFVMISYYDIRDAKNAMRHLQGNAIRRRKIDIHYSIPKENPSEKDQNQGTLVVFNLDPSIENDDILAVFRQYGEVKEIRETPNKRHHRFIEYFDVRDAEKALKFLNKTEIRGKRIKIEPSRPGGARKAYSYQWNSSNDLSLLPLNMNDVVSGGADMSNLSSALANLAVSTASTHSDASDAFGSGTEGGMVGVGDAQPYSRYPMNMAPPQPISGVSPQSREEHEALGQNSIPTTATPSSTTRSLHKSLPLPIPDHSVWQAAPSPPTLAAYGGFVMATPPYLHSPWHVAQQSPQMADNTMLLNPHAALVVSPSHPQFRHFEPPHGVDMVHPPMVILPQPAAAPSSSPGQQQQQQQQLHPPTIGIGLPLRHFSWPMPPSGWTLPPPPPPPPSSHP